MLTNPLTVALMKLFLSRVHLTHRYPQWLRSLSLRLLGTSAVLLANERVTTIEGNIVFIKGNKNSKFITLLEKVRDIKVVQVGTLKPSTDYYWEWKGHGIHAS